MRDHVLLPSQRNAVFQIVQASGLSHGEFDWEKRQSRATPPGLGASSPEVPVLVHRPTGAAFTFDFDASRRHHYAIHSPGREGPEDLSNAGTWETELRHVRQWLTYLRREHESPDPWGELERARALLGGEPSPDEWANTVFSAEERGRVVAELHGVQAHLKAYRLSETQSEAIEARLRYLEDAARRLGRVDWRNAFVGTLLGAAVAGVLPPEPVRAVLNRTSRGLQGLAGTEQRED